MTIMDATIIPLTAVVLGILTGIIAIICGTISAIKKGKDERSLRQAIIDNHVDAETARVLVTPEKPKAKSPYTSLRWGLILVGLGLGYLLSLAIGMADKPAMLILLALGIGIGLLASFFISNYLEAKKDNK